MKKALLLMAFILFFPLLQSADCFDSDGGKKPNVFGTVSWDKDYGYPKHQEKSDECVDGQIVKEWYCTSQVGTGVEYGDSVQLACADNEKCEGGKCVKLPDPEPIPEDAAQASWQLLTGYAILLSTLILIFMFMIGMAFEIRELQMAAHEEMYQIIMTMLLAAVLVGAQSYMSGLSSQFLGGSQSLQSGATLIIDVTIVHLKIFYADTLQSSAVTIGNQGAKSAFCSFMSAGINVVSCGGYRMLGTPISTGYQLMGLVLAELQSMKLLLQLGSQAFVLFLPLGIFLRAFKITRGAGALFIALGAALYFFLPLGIVFTDKLLLKPYSDYAKAQDPAADLYSIPAKPDLPDCDEWDSGDGNMLRAVQIYGEINPLMKQALSIIFLRGVFLPVVSLLIMVASIRFMTAAGGAEIDVSALSKIA